MKRRILFLAVALFAFVFACKEDDVVVGRCADGTGNCACGLGAEDNDRYIIFYEYNPSGAFYGKKLSSVGCASVSDSVLSMWVRSDGRNGGASLGLVESRRISKELGDTAFGSNLLCFEAYIGEVLYGNDVDSFSVFCDRQYDAQHPAMSSIDDIVSISFADPYAFVANGYSLPSAPQYSGVERDGETQVFVWFTDTLSNVSFCDHPHINYSFGLRLLSPPERTDTFTFTGRVVMSNGSVFEGEICRAVLEGKSVGVQ